MTKKIVSSALALIMIAMPVLTGCSSAPNQNNEPVTTTVENAVTSQPASEAASEAGAETAAQAGGGKPWIDSELKENISEDMLR